jgi:hypothetical protein
MALAVAAAGAADIAQAAQNMTRVHVNGQPLATSVAPIEMMAARCAHARHIEALGAQVNYTTPRAALRRSAARLTWASHRQPHRDDQQPERDAGQSPLIRRGSTLVPLRFVSEALGARVSWNSAQRLVSVSQGGSQVAGVRTISIPQGAVVPVTLDGSLSSADARVGQTFMATVASENAGDSEFPAGTKIEGVGDGGCGQNQRQTRRARPGFSRRDSAHGNRVPLRADLIALDNDSVVTGQGRVMAKERSGNKDRNKTIVIGAGAGFLLARFSRRTAR